jgi:hypothetical protein
MTTQTAERRASFEECRAPEEKWWRKCRCRHGGWWEPAVDRAHPAGLFVAGDVVQGADLVHGAGLGSSDRRFLSRLNDSAETLRGPFECELRWRAAVTVPACNNGIAPPRRTPR